MNELERSVHEVADSPPVRFGARAGMVAYGLLHLLIAWLAVGVALGARERADQTGALQAIADQPFGQVLLWLIVAGFVAVVVWRIRQALWGWRGLDGADRIRQRLFAVGQVLLYGVLAALAVRVAAGSSGGNGGQRPTAALLRVPGGRWLVVAVGAGVVVAGLVMIVRGVQLSFAEDMDLSRVGPVARRCIENLGRVGVIAKSVSVVLIGILVAVAALTDQPTRAEGLDVALKTLAAQPYGRIGLCAIALGLAAYGVFELFDARYHRV
jgi:hypothetical protein